MEENKGKKLNLILNKIRLNKILNNSNNQNKMEGCVYFWKKIMKKRRKIFRKKKWGGGGGVWSLWKKGVSRSLIN